MRSLAACAWATVWSLLLLPYTAALAESPPQWAYPVNSPAIPHPSAGDVPVHIPLSDRSYTTSQIKDLFNVPDWHPEDHPSMPEVVAQGRRPDVYACAYCHLADGSGRPENASLAGLPADYIEQQLTDMRIGARRTTVSARLPPQFMVAVARSATATEIKAAAEYFSRLQPQYRIRVMESDAVPHTHVAGWILAADTDAPKEPIGQRIIEVPEDLDQFEHRDARSRFLVYVPPGSVKAGEAVVKTGGPNKTIACARCHGARLKGAGIIPGIAGRSPSYIVRQLFDFQSGARAGALSAPMVGVVRHLGADDMIAIAAYLATLH